MGSLGMRSPSVLVAALISSAVLATAFAAGADAAVDPLPSGIHSVLVTGIRPDNGRAYRTGGTTSGRAIVAISAWLGRRPRASVVPPPTALCPPLAYIQPFDELTFLAANGRSVLAVVKETGCTQDLAVTVRGHTETELAENASLSTLLMSEHALAICGASQLSFLRLVLPDAGATFTFPVATGSAPIAPCVGAIEASPLIPGGPAFVPPGAPKF
jgi:hypothetical protein